MAITFHDHENQFNIYDESDCLVDLRDLAHRTEEAIILDKIHTEKQVVVLRWDFLSPYRIRYVILFLFCFFLSSLARGQVAAAAWCVVTDQKSGSKSTDQPSQLPDDPFPPQSDESESTSPLGCDIGIGFLFYRYKHLGLVGVVGSESLGGGVAWILNPQAKSDTDNRPIMAVAIGLATPYDEDGIYQDFQLTLGMTLSIRQREEE